MVHERFAQLTIVVDVMAQGGNEQNQLVHPREALGDLAAHHDHVGGVQHIYHMAEVVVGVAVVMTANCCNEGHDLPLLDLEELQHATVCEDVIHHFDLHDASESNAKCHVQVYCT